MKHMDILMAATAGMAAKRASRNPPRPGPIPLAIKELYLAAKYKRKELLSGLEARSMEHRTKTIAKTLARNKAKTKQRVAGN